MFNEPGEIGCHAPFRATPLLGTAALLNISTALGNAAGLAPTLSSTDPPWNDITWPAGSVSGERACM